MTPGLRQCFLVLGMVLATMLLPLHADSNTAGDANAVKVIGYYQLTAQDLEQLAQRQAIIDGVAALEGQMYTERYQMMNALQPLKLPPL